MFQFNSFPFLYTDLHFEEWFSMLPKIPSWPTRYSGLFARVIWLHRLEICWSKTKLHQGLHKKLFLKYRFLPFSALRLSTYYGTVRRHQRKKSSQAFHVQMWIPNRDKNLGLRSLYRFVCIAWAVFFKIFLNQTKLVI